MSKKILIVDDSASDRLIILNMLSEYEIYAACDGAEALKVLDENEDINFMILDLNINMNGSKYWRRSENKKNIAV